MPQPLNLCRNEIDCGLRNWHRIYLLYRGAKAAAPAGGTYRLAVLLAALSGIGPAAGQPAGNRHPPRWLQLGAEIRGRLERFAGLGYESGSEDTYYLHRLRLNGSVHAAKWLRFSFQMQDARAPGHRAPVPATAANTFDVRGAVAEFGAADGRGWGLRAGRQELSFGAERLVGPSNWSNVGRVFDAVRLTYQAKQARMDWFASTLVQTDKDRLDRFRTGVRLFGFYSSFENVVTGSAVEPFLLWKAVRGSSAGTHVYTAGLRLAGALPARFDYSAEMAVQGGATAEEDLRSWAGAWTLGRIVVGGEPSLKVLGEYDYASGDERAGDARRGTFDQLYPTNHSKYGIADRVGWRNMHGARGGIELRWPRGRRVSADYWSFWLARRNDFLYRANGAPVVRNPQASSSHVQQELDVYGVVPVGRRLAILAGFARVFPGGFLRESTPGSPVTFFYAGWQWAP